MDSQYFRNKNTYIQLAIFLALFILYPKLSAAPDSQNALQPRVLGAQIVNPLGSPVTTEVKAPTPRGELNLSAIKAKSFLVYDTGSHSILTERNSAQPVAIASLTKLMTGLVVYEEVHNFRDPVTITGEDVFSVQPVLHLKKGDTVTVGDLFNSMLIGSANDAALTLANYIQNKTGTQFVSLMNEKAVSLDMTNSHFSNPLGFDSETNYSTARDLQKLVIATEQYQAFKLTGRALNYSFISETGNHYGIKTTNTLLSGDKELYAIKTGFTELAQGAMVTKIEQSQGSFVIIVLDSTNREADTQILKQQIAKNYVWAD